MRFFPFYVYVPSHITLAVITRIAKMHLPSFIFRAIIPILAKIYHRGEHLKHYPHPYKVWLCDLRGHKFRVRNQYREDAYVQCDRCGHQEW